jgi:hypothetical protein
MFNITSVPFYVYKVTLRGTFCCPLQDAIVGNLCPIPRNPFWE